MLTVEPLIAAICEHFARMSDENCGDKGGRREDGGGEGCREDEGGGKGHDGHVSGGMVGSGHFSAGTSMTIPYGGDFVRLALDSAELLGKARNGAASSSESVARVMVMVVAPAVAMAMVMVVVMAVAMDSEVPEALGTAQLWVQAGASSVDGTIAGDGDSNAGDSAIGSDSGSWRPTMGEAAS